MGMSLGSGVKVENQKEGERQGGPKRKARMWDPACPLRVVGREEDIGKGFGEEAWQDWAF